MVVAEEEEAAAKTPQSDDRTGICDPAAGREEAVHTHAQTGPQGAQLALGTYNKGNSTYIIAKNPGLSVPYPLVLGRWQDVATLVLGV